MLRRLLDALEQKPDVFLHRGRGRARGTARVVPITVSSVTRQRGRGRLAAALRRAHPCELGRSCPAVLSTCKFRRQSDEDSNDEEMLPHL